MKLTSTAFAEQGEIPRRHTCEGQDVSPPLSWTGVPSGNAKSFVLIVDDPDAPDPKAPQETWVHWVLFDIPLAERASRKAALPLPRARARARTTGSAPATAARVRRSAASLLLQALRARHIARPDAEPTKGRLEQAMQGHVVEAAELVGTYQKQGK